MVQIRNTAADAQGEGGRVAAKARPRILVVAYDFPPIASAGMARVISMVRYLCRRGWDVTVLTVRDSFVRRTEANMALVPDGVTVVRTASFEAARTASHLRARARALRHRGGVLRGAVARALGLLGSAIDRMAHAVSWPDRKAGWGLPLLLRAGVLMRNNRYDVVLSSSPPHSTHAPMLVLNALMGFHWVVDFRDPWTTPSRKKRVERVQRALERRVLRRADAVVANTPGNRDALLETFRDLDAGKVTVITNGFDTDLLRQVGEVGQRRLACDMVYTGHIYPGMLEPFVEALGVLRRRGARVPTVWVYGVRPHHLHLDPETEPHFVFKEHVSFLESLSIMRAAPSLLFLVPHGRGFETWVPSKLYPYLFSGRPIFALAPKGDASSIVEETGTGVAVASLDPDHIADELQRFLDAAPAARRSRPDDPSLTPYSWNSLGDQLHTLLRARPLKS